MDQREFHLKVHPFADAFPMLSQDELLTLAKDIVANGQREPIMLSHDGTELIDGRNRLYACAMAEVKPRFERLPEGADPVAYIVSANIERRHLTKGQQAVAFALAHPEKGKRGRGNKSSVPEEISTTRLSNAREITAHADLVPLVMGGSLTFEAALGEARWRVKNAASTTDLLRQLQVEAPDLAEQVSSGKIRMYEAVSEHERRQRAAAANLKDLTEAVLQSLQRIQVVWLPRLSSDEALRAGLIDRLKIEPARVPEVLKSLEQLVATMKPV
jgi:hypothetical protein